MATGRLRWAWWLLAWASLALGVVGIVVPGLPTVPFVLLAAFCFARSSPALERRLVTHPTFGPHIQAWRTRGAISRKGKRAACVAFALSAALGLYLLQGWLALVPVAAAILGTGWIMSRPTS